MTTTILSLNHHYQEIAAVNLCTTEEWDTIIKEFPDDVRYQAANLAAHRWDVILFDDLLFIGGPSSGAYYDRQGNKTVAQKEHLDVLYPIADEHGVFTTTVWEGNTKIVRSRTIALKNIQNIDTFRVAYKALEFLYGEIQRREWSDDIDQVTKFRKIVRRLQYAWDTLRQI